MSFTRAAAALDAARAIAPQNWAMTTALPTVICVLGMHRSGTSLVTRGLSLLGVHLGPEAHMMRPREDNPLGFAEHQLLTDINDEILCRLGGTWHTPPQFSRGWAGDPMLEDCRTRARQLLQEDFGSASLWGWKDPRTCLTLPFWQQLVPSMRHVICIRSPLDVARSLEARDGFSIEKGASLWVDYLSGALGHTSGQPRLFLSFDDLIERQGLEVDRLAAFIGQPSAAAACLPSIRAFTDATLRHHRAQIVAVVDECELPFPAKALYLSLLLLLDVQRRGPESRSGHGDTYETAVERFSEASRLTQASAQEREALEEQIRMHLAELIESSRRAAEETDGLRQTLATRERERDDERARAAESSRRAVEEADALRRTLAGRERERDDERAHAALLQVELDASRTWGEAVEDDRDRLRESSARLREELDASRRRLAYLETPAGSVKMALRALLPHRLYAGLKRIYAHRPIWLRSS